MLAAHNRVVAMLPKRPQSGVGFRGWACGVLALGLAFLANGQSGSNWRSYKVSDGLPESACISVTFSSYGRVLARHYNLPYISELDGYGVNRVYAPKAGPGRVYGGANGQMWTSDPQGLLEFRDGNWIDHELSEIAAHLASRSSRSIDPLALYPFRRYAVLCLMPDRLLQISLDQPGEPRRSALRETGQAGIGTFLSMAPARDGGLWISGERGVSKLTSAVRNLTSASQWVDHVIPPGLEVGTLIDPRENHNGGVVLIGERPSSGGKAIVVFDGTNWVARATGTERVRAAWFGPEGKLWATTISSLRQADDLKADFLLNEQVSARQFLDVAIEPDGAFWLATSEGLLRYALLPWRVPHDLRDTSTIRALAAGAQGKIWVATANDFFSYGTEGVKPRKLPAELHQQLRAVYAIDDRLYFETESQILQMSGDQAPPRVLLQARAEEQLNVLGRLRDESLVICRSRSGENGNAYEFENLDALRIRPLSWPKLPPDIGELNAICQTRNTDIWVAGSGGVACLRENRWAVYRLPGPSQDAVTHLLETVDGRLLAATRDTLWQHQGTEWTVLRMGFDQVNSLIQSRDGSIWVASNSGVFRFFRDYWMHCGSEEGIPDSNVRQLLEDTRGELWAATGRGLVQFVPKTDQDPPRTVIRKLPANATETQNSVTMVFVAQDKWKQTPRERLVYSQRLDDGDWSPFTESTETFLDELSAGKHVFQVRSMDRNFNVETEPARYEFEVVLPWYQETRLLIIALMGVFAALFFAALAINRHRQLLRSYASVEKKVAERTHELEIASQQLVHSQKMTALGTLAAGVAHDFNNILSVIKGSAQIIEENLDKPDKVRARLDRIKMVVDQGAGTIRAMLGFSRESGQQPVMCDLRDIAEDTVRLLGERLVRQAPVKLRIGTDVPPVPGSPDLIQQILFNFLFNAAESMTGEKGILLSTRRLSALPSGLVLAPVLAESYAAISVQDWGSGIPKEILPRIFEPFFTTKGMSARRGTGLGLSMVYELARKMGAGLAVDSVVDAGSTFTLILPIKEIPDTDPSKPPTNLPLL